MEKPEKTIKAGSLILTIWNNNSEKGSFKTITLQRSYKDSKGEWKHTSNLRINDLPKASMLLNKAYEYISITE